MSLGRAILLAALLPAGTAAVIAILVWQNVDDWFELRRTGGFEER